MHISADQCRAARGLLDWTQDRLAKNANVSRATVTDFEANNRQPMTNNLRSIAGCIFSAGIEFIPEQDGRGVGVRFREQKLEFINNIMVNQYNGRATIPMRFAGESFFCHVNLGIIRKHHERKFETDEEYRKATKEMLGVILYTAERIVESHVRDGEMTITRELVEEHQIAE